MLTSVDNNRVVRPLSMARSPVPGRSAGRGVCLRSKPKQIPRSLSPVSPAPSGSE
jgi:hypothetical protein